MPCLESRKFEWFIKQVDDSDEDLSFFPYLNNCLPQKAVFEFTVTKHRGKWDCVLQNNLLNSSASSSDKSWNTFEDNSPTELYYILGIDVNNMVGWYQYKGIQLISSLL